MKQTRDCNEVARRGRIQRLNPHFCTCREAEGPSRSAIAGGPADAAAASEIRTPELSVANLGPPQRRRTWREPLDHMMSVYPPVSGAETPALASETAH
jgi:hypothetical protein